MSLLCFEFVCIRIGAIIVFLDHALNYYTYHKQKHKQQQAVDALLSLSTFAFTDVLGRDNPQTCCYNLGLAETNN